MTNPNNNNYVLARWRDAHMDPPEYSSVPVVVKSGGNIQDLRFRARNGMWVAPDWADGDYDEIEIEPGDQWLDVTDVPAVPRAQVQAAVDEIAFEARADQTTARHDREQSRYHYARFDGRKNDLAWIERHTGVTPTEVL